MSCFCVVFSALDALAHKKNCFSKREIVSISNFFSEILLYHFECFSAQKKTFSSCFLVEKKLGFLCYVKKVPREH